MTLWAKSTYREGKGKRKRVWHRVTVADWDPGKLKTACNSGSHVLQRRGSEQRTDPPLIDICTKCERVGKGAP